MSTDPDAVIVPFPHTHAADHGPDAAAEIVHLLEEAAMLDAALDEIENGVRRLHRARAAKVALYGLLTKEPATNAELRSDWLAHHSLAEAKRHLGYRCTGGGPR